MDEQFDDELSIRNNKYAFESIDYVKETMEDVDSRPAYARAISRAFFEGARMMEKCIHNGQKVSDLQNIKHAVVKQLYSKITGGNPDVLEKAFDDGVESVIN